MKLRKLLNAPGPAIQQLGNYSAVWEFQELPGLLLRKAELYPKGTAWKVFADGRVEDGSLSDKVAARLEDQRFQTRQEAVQAVQAAIDVVQASLT